MALERRAIDESHDDDSDEPDSSGEPVASIVPATPGIARLIANASRWLLHRLAFARGPFPLLICDRPTSLSQDALPPRGPRKRLNFPITFERLMRPPRCEGARGDDVRCGRYGAHGVDDVSTASAPVERVGHKRRARS